MHPTSVSTLLNERVLNDYHFGACGGHMSGYARAKKSFMSVIFYHRSSKISLAVQKCHAYKIYNRKQHTPPTALHPIITIKPFAKWGIDIMTCKPRSSREHGYIIVPIDYFTKWAEAMPTCDSEGKTATQFIFNHIIAQ